MMDQKSRITLFRRGEVVSVRWRSWPFRRRLSLLSRAVAMMASQRPIRA